LDFYHWLDSTKTNTLFFLDREEALKDDYQYDPGAYDYGGDDDWADEDASWGEDGTQSAEAPQPGQEAEPATEGRDESSAYLDFLNEEVSEKTKKEEEVTCG
jgi:hypothetical protein